MYVYINLCLHNYIYIDIIFYFIVLPIRLVCGGLFPFSGRVEIYSNGEWGTVCRRQWSKINSQVVCKQLGYEYYYASEATRGIPAGKGPILMENVTCYDDQINLLACPHSGFENHNCGHLEDVAVQCSSSRKLFIRI